MDLRRLSRRQHDVVSRAQALKAGLTPSQIRCRLDSGRWQRIHPGIYATHNGPVTWPARASAATLHAGTGAALILGSSAYLWGLADREPAVITVGVPLERKPVRVVGTRIRRLRRLETAIVERLTVTTRAQTVIDLAGEPGCDIDEAVALAARAAQRRHLSAADLLVELRARHRHPHGEVLAMALGDIDGGVEGAAEFRFVRDVQRAHDLPELVRQVVTRDGARRDFESDEFGVVIEVDGQLWHAGERFHSDRRRDRRTATKGKVPLRSGWLDVAAEPCELARDIALTLRQRGWTGALRRCSPGCPIERVACRRSAEPSDADDRADG